MLRRHCSLDPVGTYSQMDFATRDRYRHTVERIARLALLSEEEVALEAVKLSQESYKAKGGEDRSAHIGFYLIDKGLPELERAAGMSRSLMAVSKWACSPIPPALLSGDDNAFYSTHLCCSTGQGSGARIGRLDAGPLFHLPGDMHKQSCSRPGELAGYCAGQSSCPSPEWTSL